MRLLASARMLRLLRQFVLLGHKDMNVMLTLDRMNELVKSARDGILKRVAV